MTELLYQVFVSPTKGLREVVSRKPLGWAMVLIVIYALINAMVSQQMNRLILLQLGPETDVVAPPNIGVSIISSLISIFITVGILHIIARLLKGQGGYVGLLCGAAFASLPFIFLAPLALIAPLLGIAGLLLFGMGSLVIMLWALILTILAIKYNNHFSSLRAILTFILAIPIVVLLTILLSLIFPGVL